MTIAPQKKWGAETPVYSLQSSSLVSILPETSAAPANSPFSSIEWLFNLVQFGKNITRQLLLANGSTKLRQEVELVVRNRLLGDIQMTGNLTCFAHPRTNRSSTHWILTPVAPLPPMLQLFFDRLGQSVLFDVPPARRYDRCCSQPVQVPGGSKLLDPIGPGTSGSVGRRPFPPQMIGQLVRRNREQVRLQRPLVVVVRQTREEPDERLLDHVFRNSPTANTALDKSKKPSPQSAQSTRSRRRTLRRGFVASGQHQFR